MISQESTQTHSSSGEATMASSSPTGPDLWIGRVLGSYQVLDRLDAGAMGTVYRARHRLSGAPAAVKTVPTLREGLLPRIRREIHALAHIRHPGIVRILESGTLDGVPWYAMELVEGVTLRQYVPPPGQGAKLEELNERLELVHYLCGALAYLHGEGLIHRDLKPGNVLVRPGRQPVLVDFGLVSEVPGAAGREALDLELGTVGTPLYMAPEQIQGDLLDARTDLYALGCILYELMCGHPPFKGKRRTELLQAHLSQAPQPPSELLPDLPPVLDDLCLRLLAKDPRERLGYADDVAAVLDGLGIGRRTPKTTPRPRAYLYRPGFAGRGEALGVLSEGLSHLLEGRGGCVLIGGESGIGKTRLAMEAARLAERAKIRVYTGECVPEQDTQGRGGGPLHPLRRLLQAVADRCWEHGLPETDRLLGRRGAVLSLYEPALALLPGQLAQPQPAELPPEAARLRLFDDLAETFSALSFGPAPALLLLDDLQWADGLTLGFLRFLLETQALERMAWLIIGTYRVEEVQVGLREILDAPVVRRFELGRLDLEAVGSIVRDMLALPQPPPLFVSFLGSRSGGNPFFVAEYLRVAVAEGLLYRDERGRWQLAEQGEDAATQVIYENLPLPHSVHELVGRRLEALSPPARRAAEAAAVLGRESEESLLAATASLEGSEAFEALEELRARQVLEVAETQQHAAPRLRFLHDQIWEIAYGRIEPARRQQLHRIAAETLEARLGMNREEHLGVLGHHWQQAGEPLHARSCYLAGARRARARYAHGEAERLYRANLELAEAHSAESVEVRNELALELGFQSRPLEALEEHGAALESARKLGERAAEVQTLQWMGDLHTTIGNMSEAGGLYSEALALARQIGDRRGEGNSIMVLANLSYTQGRTDEARRGLEEALAISRAVGNRKGEGSALNRMASLEMHHGHPEQARSIYEQALLIHQEIGDRRAAGVNLANLGVLHNHLGLREVARAYFERALGIFREIGYHRFEAHALANLANFHSEEGRVQQGGVLYDQALTILRDIGDRQWTGIVLSAWASWLRRMGRLAEADQRVRQALEILRGIGDRLHVATCLCSVGHVELAGGRLEAARQALGQALELATEMKADPGGPVGRSVESLRQSVAAAEAGQAMFRGEPLAELPEGLLRWLLETGQLQAEG